MAEGYEDIEKLTSNQNQMLDNALKQQNNIVKQQTNMNIADIERNKQKLDEDVNKTNKALYTDYKKQSNPYGANAERLASQGLLNSGYAETTQTNLYNTYQKNVTDTLNNARNLKADFDNEITKARQTGNLTIAQNALDIYKQKMQLLTQEYELKNNREQFLYQKSQDALNQNNWEKQFAETQKQNNIANNQWQKTFDYNKGRDHTADWEWRKTFEYNKSRDKIADSQWQKQYELSKKASARSSSSRSRSSSGSSRSYGSSNVATVNAYDNNEQESTSQNTQSTNKYLPIINDALGMIAQGIIKNTSPNSNERRTQLQKLVNGGALTQDEANRLVSA